MNTVEYDPRNIPTPAESRIYSELVSEIAHDFGGKLSEVMYLVTVDYPALSTSTTYRFHYIESACKAITRSQSADLPVSWRVTLKPEVAAERIEQMRWKRILPARTLNDVIQNSKDAW
jgi:hypothetical protein